MGPGLTGIRAFLQCVVALLGFGIRVLGVGFRVLGSGLRVLKFTVLGLGV